MSDKDKQGEVIKDGDYVLTPKGYATVTFVGNHGISVYMEETNLPANFLPFEVVVVDRLTEK
jgi:hypothetical protein